MAVYYNMPSVVHHYMGGGYTAIWEPGTGPNSLLECSYDKNGVLEREEWEPGKGPGGLLVCERFPQNGNLRYLAWEPGKRPQGMMSRAHWVNGLVEREEWREGDGPGGLIRRDYYRKTGELEREEWEPGKGPGGLLYSMYSSRQNPDSLSENDLSKGVFCF